MIEAHLVGKYVRAEGCICPEKSIAGRRNEDNLGRFRSYSVALYMLDQIKKLPKVNCLQRFFFAWHVHPGFDDHLL